MKRLLFMLLLCGVVIALRAVPARPGVWKTLTLKDGTEVRALLSGDEFRHCWKGIDGRQYVKAGDSYMEIDATTKKFRSMSFRTMSRRAAQSSTILSRRVTPGAHTHFTGHKKGLVILAEFTDVKFKTGNNRDKYDDILNKEGYTSQEGFVGSVYDYFKAQSGGQFELNFDVFGPVALKHPRKYYGENDEDDNDMRPEEMIIEACKAVNSQVDFRNYDWDEDGEVDEVFVVYADKGEADGGSSYTIWPHMYALEWSGNRLILDQMRINTYACANEINHLGNIEGIGGFCHEFSHCLGYPDLYDVANGFEIAWGEYDLMDGGCYNGNGFRPAGYSAYEKWMAGWINLTVLSDKNVTVSNMKPISEGGNGYIIYNDGHPDEYYILENRQQTNWDQNIPGRGLLITHVDFDSLIWYLNVPNSILTSTDSYVTDYDYPLNDHARIIIVRADNKASLASSSMAHDLYPYLRNDSLTATSKPAAIFHNFNMQGNRFMQGAILKIKQNLDGTVNFVYRSPFTDTGIHEVLPDAERKQTGVYDLQGRRYTENSLTKGLYIMNGKKVMVR